MHFLRRVQEIKTRPGRLDATLGVSLVRASLVRRPSTWRVQADPAHGRLGDVAVDREPCGGPSASLFPMHRAHTRGNAGPATRRACAHRAGRSPGGRLPGPHARPDSSSSTSSCPFYWTAKAEPRPFALAVRPPAANAIAADLARCRSSLPGRPLSPQQHIPAATALQFGRRRQRAKLRRLQSPARRRGGHRLLLRPGRTHRRHRVDPLVPHGHSPAPLRLSSGRRSWPRRRQGYGCND
jgi:hypothetical protein